jgi:regulation of enolase protein 1 (concanavalin A-like superfamily)
MTMTGAFPTRRTFLTFAGLVVLGVLAGSGLLTADEPKVLFEEKFTDKLDKNWSWVREEPKAWRLDKGALVLDVLPGSLWMTQHSAKNVLLRPAPLAPKDGFVIEVQLENTPKNQFEHAGLVCYYDDENYVTCNKEFIKTQRVFLVSEKNGKPTGGPDKEYDKPVIWFRMIVKGEKVKGQYRATEKDEWQTIAEAVLPSSDKKLQVGLLSGYGAEKPERQAKFQHFRIMNLPK